MRTLLTIAFTMFTMAGCLDEAPAPEADEPATTDRRLPGGEAPEEPPPPKRPDMIPGDELNTSPHEVTHCVVSDDCVLADPDTEYRMCALRLARAFVADPEQRLDTSCAETRRLRLVR